MHNSLLTLNIDCILSILMREGMGSHLQIRNWMMEIADLIIPKLKNTIKDESGNTPRYISVHDLSVDYENLDEVIEFHGHIHYLSDIGDFQSDILVRYFHSIQNYMLECVQYDKLVGRTNFFTNIEPVKVLVRNDEEQIVVYVTPKGQEISQLKLDENIYHFQLGILIGILQGGETMQIPTSDYELMCKYLLTQLKFEKSVEAQLQSGIASQLSILADCRAGYEPVSLVDLNHIRCSILDEPVTKSKIIQDRALYIELLPSLMPNLVMDRMEDIAGLFAKMAYWEYLDSRDIKSTLFSIISVLEGYEGYFEQYSMAPMDQIYPSGLTLDLHMLLGVWLYHLDLLNRGEKFDMYQLSKYSLFILSEHPFQIYGK